MSVEHKFTCDCCGKIEIRKDWERPKGWAISSPRGLRLMCAECAPPIASTLALRSWMWCLWNPARATLIAFVLFISLIITITSLLISTRMMRMMKDHERALVLEREHLIHSLSLPRSAVR